MNLRMLIFKAKCIRPILTLRVIVYCMNRYGIDFSYLLQSFVAVASSSSPVDVQKCRPSFVEPQLDCLRRQDRRRRLLPSARDPTCTRSWRTTAAWVARRTAAGQEDSAPARHSPPTTATTVAIAALRAPGPPSPPGTSRCTTLRASSTGHCVFVYFSAGWWH